MKNNVIQTNTKSSEEEKNTHREFYDLFSQTPIPDNELLSNLGLYLNRQTLSRILFMHELYKKIINVNGVIIEFGCRWGQNLALFESLRGIYEPYNYLRKIIAFDTFSGFPSVHEKDGNADIIQKGAYGVTNDYEKYLQQILTYHEKQSPLAHIQKFDIRKGNASEEFKKYLKKHPETIIALAFFDFDIYEPTRDCLMLMKEHITKGTVIGFDELNFDDCPGETIALQEVLGLHSYSIRRFPICPTPSYIIIE